MNQAQVAIISNSLTPYRLHFHRRLVRELPTIEWWSVFTHDVSNAPWALRNETEIRPVRFGLGERADDQSNLRRAGHEYRKGGRIIQWLVDNGIKAVVLLGYNDPGRIRILSWCSRHHVPCFVFGDSNIRGDVSFGVKAWLKRQLLPRLLRRATGALPCGSLGRAYFRKYGVPDNRIFEMPYEPDYAMIQSFSPEEVCSEYQQLHLPVNRRLILYCGRLVQVKRVDLLIDAFAAIADRRADWDLVILGDGRLKHALMNRVSTVLCPRVHWLGFIGEQQTIAKIQRGAHVLALPSDFEPWGVVINEAVAAGLAVIASDAVGAAADLVRDQFNGRIFAQGNREALVAALTDITDETHLSKYRANAASALADWRRIADPVQGVQLALASVGIHAQ